MIYWFRYFSIIIFGEIIKAPEIYKHFYNDEINFDGSYNAINGNI